MRFLHTSDWHLGRALHGASLIEDQSGLLDQLVDVAREARLDAVVVAGDVYDRGVPPTEAVHLLDEVLCRLVHGLRVPVVVVAGNHDSPERLGFAADLLKGQGLHIQGEADGQAEPVVLTDQHGPVHVYPLAFADPIVVRYRLERPDLHGHQETLKCLLNTVRSRHPVGTRSVVVGHCFVSGLAACESERPLSVGGAEAVAPATFAGCDYVALGHLHRRQQCLDGRIQYSGSLMRYSFAEADHDNGVLVVEMDATGSCRVEQVSLTPRRQVRCLTGTLAEVLAAAETDDARQDYLMVTLMDEGPVFDAMGKLRQVYPNVLQLDRAALAVAAAAPTPRLDHRRTGDAELFAAFFAEVTGQRPDQALAAVFAGVAGAVRRRETGGEA